MRVVDKNLTMPAYCVAANCNNSQTIPGITMHELPRSRPAVRRKWIKFIQIKRADFLAAPHHAHLLSEHFSECDFANPMEYCMGFASKLTRCSGTLSKSCLRHSGESLQSGQLSSEDETDTLPERPTRIQPYQFESVRQDFERVT